METNDVTAREGDGPARTERWLASFIGDGPDKAIEQVRTVSGPELAQLELAQTLVRGLHRHTPYHRLEDAKRRYRISAQQAGSISTAAEAEAEERALSALRDALRLAVDQVALWDVWIRERLGDWRGFNGADEDFNADPAIATARALLADDDVTIVIDPDIALSRIEGWPTAGSHVISDLFAVISRPVVILVANVTEGLKQHIDGACLMVNRLAAEVLLGEAVLMEPFTPPQPSNVTFTRLDKAEVQAAQLFVRHAKRLAEQAATDHGPADDPEAHDEGTATERDTRQPDGAPEAIPMDAPGDVDSEDSGIATTPERELPTVEVDLRRVIDAIADDVDGLAATWSRRFPVDEYEALVEREKHMASSVVAPLLARLEADGEAARALGLNTRLDRYPPPMHSLRNWRSDSDGKERWAQESVGSLMAFEHFSSTLQELSRPRRLTIREQRVQEIEFDPAAIVIVQEAGRLVATIVDEVSRSVASLAGEEPPGSTVREEVTAQWQEVRMADTFSMPEATLLHAIRLARLLEKHRDLGAELNEVVVAAEAELARFVAGSNTSRGISFGLASALIRAEAPHVEAVVYPGLQRGLHTEASGEETPAPPNQPAVDASTLEHEADD